MEFLKNKRRILCTLIVFACALLIIVGALPRKTASADTTGAYAFSVAEYKIIYDIGSDCSISVSEELTIDYKGYSSTGFIRDIPVNAGASVRNVNVKKVVNGSLTDVWYDVYSEDSDFISVDIGDSTYKKGLSETYLLTYRYNISNSIVNKGMLPVNPVGTGWSSIIEHAVITVLAPKGYLSADCYTGAVGSEERLEFVETTENDGRTRIFAEASNLRPYEGVTFDLTFEKGAIKSYFDFTPYYFVLGGAVILLIIVLLRLFVFNKDKVTPVINFEAPDKIDPLYMGKLIDNRVDSVDICSMLYHWADRGYIKIDLTDSDDPTLIRIMRELPENCESYEKILYTELFGAYDAVKTSSLRNRFYRTVEKVTGIVNNKAKGLYDKKSSNTAFVFALFGGLLLGLAPMFLSLFGISVKFSFLFGFVGIIPAVLIYGVAQSIKYNAFKSKKTAKLLGYGGVAFIGIITCVFYSLLLPSSIIPLLPKILLVLISCAISGCSALLISRTREYTERLNDIVGFKRYIELTEKDQLEKMIETDPQFYYHVLPYAQVLGVSDVWEKKFEEITLPPPSWAVSTSIIEFHIINRAIRTSSLMMSANMVSRPSSSGRNGGGFGGGGFGGHSGGGFGGGGGRGR